MPPEWTESPVTIAIVVAATLLVVTIAATDAIRGLIDSYRKAQAGQPRRRHLHL